VTAVTYTSLQVEWEKICQKKDELQDNHTLVFPSGARTRQIILLQKEKIIPCLSAKRKHLDQTELLVCRMN